MNPNTKNIVIGSVIGIVLGAIFGWVGGNWVDTHSIRNIHRAKTFLVVGALVGIFIGGGMGYLSNQKKEKYKYETDDEEDL